MMATVFIVRAFTRRIALSDGKKIPPRGRENYSLAGMDNSISRTQHQ
ncbi:hypothetical protein BN1221_04401c [Brenneria goodwinii]|uniref:Uncharacterized protein n=1 Tax=Brenneria goodwinii TaxID=1109412 RepID=A0A0G4K104_9GAMM|nr:hypothetical protein BN1221_04401c [Brenneria goodwinii]